MKLSDYVIKFIEDFGIHDVFLLPGGGMMHLLDSLAKNENIRKYTNLNEQATTIACEAYALYTKRPGAAFLTSGPGSTNAITGVVNAFIDSTPLIIISGQAKTADLMTGKNVRQIGPQECDIIQIVSSVTKYAVSVRNAGEIRYHLEKAAYLAMNGRRGPVWLEIPLDIQSAMIDEDKLQGYDPPQQSDAVHTQDAKEIYQLMNNAQRPAILIGNGVRCCASREFIDWIHELNIPVLSSWRARDVLTDQYDLYFGCPGTLAPRYSNFIIQNCDFLLVIGARLNYSMTAFNEQEFAPLAKKVVVDIDPNELALLKSDYRKKISADAKEFICAMQNNIALFANTDIQEWINYCKQAKKAFPLQKENQPNPLNYIDGYHLGFALTQHLKTDDVIVSASSGRASAIAPMSLGTTTKNRFITAMGLGSMGYALPLSIGACVASKKRVVCIEGDGSLQHNLQELQLVKTYGLPLKLFIVNNNGYASIYGMQKNHFKGRFLSCNPESNLALPRAESIAKLYGLNYFYAQDEKALQKILPAVMADDAACICEIKMDIGFEEIPRSATKLDENGKPYSAPLDDLFPFLSQDQIERFNI